MKKLKDIDGRSIYINPKLVAAIGSVIISWRKNPKDCEWATIIYMSGHMQNFKVKDSKEIVIKKLGL